MFQERSSPIDMYSDGLLDDVIHSKNSVSAANDGKTANNCSITEATDVICRQISAEQRGKKRPRDESKDCADMPASKSGKVAGTARSQTVANKNPASVAKRNARERRRIKNVNLAFDELREHVPSGDQSKKKISKVDTLQSAIEYIKALEKLVKRKRMIEKETGDGQDEDEEESGEFDDQDSVCATTPSTHHDVTYSDSIVSANSLESEAIDDDVICIQDEKNRFENSPINTEDDVVFIQSTEPVSVEHIHTQRSQSEGRQSTGELHPLMQEFDSLVDHCVERNRQMIPSGQPIEDLSRYIDFDDSGYSDDSTNIHCDRNNKRAERVVKERFSTGIVRENSVLHPSSKSSSLIQASDMIQMNDAVMVGQLGATMNESSTTDSSLNEVSVDEIQTLLGGPGEMPDPVYGVNCEPNLQHSVYSPGFRCSSWGTTHRENFDFNAAQNPFPMASTPRETDTQEAGSAFLFPPSLPGSNWAYHLQQPTEFLHSQEQNCAPISNIRDTSFEGYRFGDTLR